MPAAGVLTRSLHTALWVGLAGLAGEVALLGAIYRSETLLLRSSAREVTVNLAPDTPSWWRFEHPGVDRPAARPAAAAELRADEEVVGIVVGRHARAYRLQGLAHPTYHIVNDRVGDIPISITYCDLTDCLRAFVGPSGGPSLDVSQAGLFDHEMILKIQGRHYRQGNGLPPAGEPAAPPFPYPTLRPVRTTWREWTRLHPRTDVCLGHEPDGLPGRTGPLRIPPNLEEER